MFSVTTIKTNAWTTVGLPAGKPWNQHGLVPCHPSSPKSSWVFSLIFWVMLDDCFPWSVSCHLGWGPGEWVTQLTKPYLALDPGLLQILAGLRDPSGGEWDEDSGFTLFEEFGQEPQHQHPRRPALLSDRLSGEELPHPRWLLLACFPPAYTFFRMLREPWSVLVPIKTYPSHAPLGGC